MKESTWRLIQYKLRIGYVLELESHTFFYIYDPYLNGPSSIQAAYYKHENEFYLVSQKARYSENEFVRVLNLLSFT